MPWRERLWREALISKFDEFDLCYHVSLHPAFPDDYDAPGIVAITFRLRERAPPDGGHVYVTALDPSAALRLGERFGLDAGQALAMVDSHERIHIYAQLAGVREEDEEDAVRVVDRAWLSLRHEEAESLIGIVPEHVVATSDDAPSLQ